MGYYKIHYRNPSYYLDMKLHRWVFISPGSHCLLMIIRGGRKFACSHAVNHFPHFSSSPALHLRCVFFFLYSLFFIQRMQILEVKFYTVCSCATVLQKPFSIFQQQNERVGGQAGRWKVIARCSALSNQRFNESSTCSPGFSAASEGKPGLIFFKKLRF